MTHSDPMTPGAGIITVFPWITMVNEAPGIIVISTYNLGMIGIHMRPMKVYLTLLFRMKVPRIRGDEGSKWIIAINMYYYLVLMQLNTVYSYSLKLCKAT